MMLQYENYYYIYLISMRTNAVYSTNGRMVYQVLPSKFYVSYNAHLQRNK
jgi:hypothetical protein